MPALSGDAWGGDAWEGAALEGLPWGEEVITDPLAIHDDEFNGGEADVEDRGWAWYDEVTVATQSISGGELNLVATGGSATGSWWFTAAAGARNEGHHMYRDGLITGAFDARAEVRVRNAADTDDPPSTPGEFRFVYLMAHDPNRAMSVRNWVAVGLGGDPTSQVELIWLTTDDDGVNWASTTAQVSGSSPGNYQLRIDRRASDTDIFDLYHRRTDLGLPLEHDALWVLSQTIDRSSNSPARTAPATPVALPAALEVGLCGGSGNPVGLDIQSFWDRFIIRTSTA